MSAEGPLAGQFDAHRDRLRQIAYRMLGSSAEADDAVQETWLRLQRADVRRVENPGGWLTTVLSRICLDLLRVRRSRREEPAGLLVEAGRPDRGPGGDPEREAILAESVGLALLVVLRRLAPAERVALVLHDMFDVPFEEIGPIVARSAVAARKLASRARRRVRGTPAIRREELVRHRRVIEAFLAASRAGDVDAVMAVLAPDVVRRADRAALPPERATEIRGARKVAEEIAVFGRNARFAEVALLDGALGLVVAPRGRLLMALRFTIEGGKIAGYELVADPARLERLDLACPPLRDEGGVVYQEP